MAYSLTVELFTELSLGILIFALRFFARWRTVGFQGYGWDDAAAGIAVVFWILEATFLYTCGVYGNNIGLDSATAAAIPESEVPQLRLGSKLAYAAWMFYILVIWAMKSVLLFLYLRITSGVKQQKLVIMTIGFAFMTFCAAVLWHICSCLPTYRAWQIKPFPGDNCTIRKGNYIVITVLDVVTDLVMMAVILPMLLRTKLDTAKKLTLCLLVSSVLFVMVCAIVRAYFSIKSINTLTVALGWASREIFAACIVVCAPGLKPLFSRVRARFVGYHSHSSYSDATKSHGGPYGRDTVNTMSGAGGNDKGTTTRDRRGTGIELSSHASATIPFHKHHSVHYHRNESQEHIIGVHAGPEIIAADSDSAKEPGIRVKTEWTIESA